MSTPRIDLLRAMAGCTEADLKEVAAILAETDPAKAFTLGLALYKANPVVQRQGCSTEPMAQVVAGGIAPPPYSRSGRIERLRTLRKACPHLNLTQVRDLDLQIAKGIPHAVVTTLNSQAVEVAAAWRRSGFQVRLEPVLRSQNIAVSLQQQVSHPATAS